MTMQEVTVRLADNIYQPAHRLAELTGNSLEDILGAMLELSVSPFVPQVDLEQPLSALPDDDLVALTQVQMQPDRDRRLSELLHQQQNHNPTEAEQIELQTLMRVYEIGMVYRAQALKEAVERGLKARLES